LPNPTLWPLVYPTVVADRLLISAYQINTSPSTHKVFTTDHPLTAWNYNSTLTTRFPYGKTADGYYVSGGQSNSIYLSQDLVTWTEVAYDSHLSIVQLIQGDDGEVYVSYYWNYGQPPSDFSVFKLRGSDTTVGAFGGWFNYPVLDSIYSMKKVTVEGDMYSTYDTGQLYKYIKNGPVLTVTDPRITVRKWYLNQRMTINTFVETQVSIGGQGEGESRNSSTRSSIYSSK